MIKKLQLILVPVALLALWHCQNKQSAKPVLASIETNMMTTHKEAFDTLRVDTTAPLLPSNQRLVRLDSAKMLLANVDLSPLIVNTWPDNGFYGKDNYRIEFIILNMKRSPDNPLVYMVEGKNRFKKTISTFKGTLEVTQLIEFKDKNLDSMALADLEFTQSLASSGKFSFMEDSSMVSSGHFSGTFKMDFAIKKDGTVDLWYYTEDTPAKGCGYRFDGNWVGYKNTTTQKPVLWSRDLFRFANDILENFSYGEREVEINEKYRHLGWQNYWDGEEWWNDSPKQNM